MSDATRTYQTRISNAFDEALAETAALMAHVEH
jgi:hypothetical protein